MHEFSAVQAIVEGLVGQLKRQNINHVSEIRIRRNSAFPEDVLAFAFETLVRGTPLQTARLVIDTVDLEHECVCGRKQRITMDNRTGHIYICPACGAISELGVTHDLEVIEVLIDVLAEAVPQNQ